MGAWIVKIATDYYHLRAFWSEEIAESVVAVALAIASSSRRSGSGSSSSSSSSTVQIIATSATSLGN